MNPWKLCIFTRHKKNTQCVIPYIKPSLPKPFYLTFHFLGGTKMFIKSLFIYFVRMLLKHLHALSTVDASFITKNLVVKVGIRIFLKWQPTRMKWEKRSSIKNFLFFKDTKLNWRSAHWSGGPSMRPCLIFEPTICFACQTNLGHYRVTTRDKFFSLMLLSTWRRCKLSTWEFC